MKTKLIYLTAFIVQTVNVLFAQQTSTIPLDFRIQGDSMIIEYDLSSAKAFKFFDVRLEITLNGNTLNAKTLSGDLKKVSPESGRKIIWNLAADSIQVMEGSLNVSLHLYPDRYQQNSLFKSPIFNKVSFGVLFFAGVGSVILGIHEEAEASKAYRLYEDNRKEWYPVFEAKSREDYYQEANRQHIKAQWLSYSGGAVAVLSGALFVLNLKKSTKSKKNGLSPLLQQDKIGVQFKF